MPENHYAKLVQVRISERAESEIAALASSRGLSKASFLREMIYEKLGLTPPKEMP